MLEILGYLAAVVMGTLLGLMGGGGSILAVPILVYIFQVPPVLATAYSLFIVGLTSAFGVLGYARKGQLDWKVGFSFSLPALIGVFSARKFIVPALPETLMRLGSFEISKDTGLMLLFAVMMLAASISMIRGRKEKEPQEAKALSSTKKIALVSIEGLVVGVLTGLVGAGGGFLVIPVLVVLAGLEMKTAVGTSLLVIAIKSLTGFLGDLGGSHNIDWIFLLGFSSCTILGVFIGGWLSRFVSGNKLKPAFGWFVLAMGVIILLTSASGGAVGH